MNNSSSSLSVAEVLATEIEPMSAGTRIPSNRELIRRFEVSATTVSQALSILAQRGLITTRPGAGTFRSRERPEPIHGDTSWQQAALELSAGLSESTDPQRSFLADGLLSTLSLHGPDVIDLNGGYLHPNLQPLFSLRSALSRAARRPDAWDRVPASGLPELRTWFAQDIGGGLTRDDVLISSGGQSALSTTMRVLTQPGDPILLESPTYPGSIAAAQSESLRPVSVPSDRHGMRPDYLEDALTRTRARVIVVQPLFQNPTGTSLSRDRRDQLRKVAREHEAFIVEDDFARHMIHSDSPDVPPPMIADDPDGTVIHIRSLTKVTSPNLRVAALAAKGPVMSMLRSGQAIDLMSVAAPLQHMALEVVTAPAWKRSLIDLAEQLRQRRETAVGAIYETFGAEALTSIPHGGYHLWVELPSMTSSSAFAAGALARGVAVTAGGNYQPTDRQASHIRISYVAAPTADDVASSIRKLDGLSEALE
ncbi:aminotransferase-like domain-containing protein [Rothia uropygialis]|uniref:aminotransferase-like domain-containing protein n=1 Tax=Kocuria sp. 36 TaxID=1415402 RepID=UPI00101DA73A|nr:PLP-dependent aminotransferase family protein [Kocuria sp. 36]